MTNELQPDYFLAFIYSLQGNHFAEINSGKCSFEFELSATLIIF